MTKHILIIDDDADIREVATMALEVAGGWRVSTADGGAKGIEVAAQERPDAILLDYMMPEMDGPATFDGLQARDDTRDIPVLFLTARTAPDLQQELEGKGARGVLEKPFDPMTLADDIKGRLGWP